MIRHLSIPDEPPAGEDTQVGLSGRVYVRADGGGWAIPGELGPIYLWREVVCREELLITEPDKTEFDVFVSPGTSILVQGSHRSVEIFPDGNVEYYKWDYIEDEWIDDPYGESYWAGYYH